MIPEVKEIGTKLEALLLADREAFSQSKVPVLLEWPAISISAEVAKACRTIWPDGWSECKIGAVQITIQTVVKASVSHSLTDCSYQFRRSWSSGSTKTECHAGS